MRLFFSYFKLVSCLALVFFTACATIPKLEVTYNTMPKSNILVSFKSVYMVTV